MNAYTWTNRAPPHSATTTTVNKATTKCTFVDTRLGRCERLAIRNRSKCGNEISQNAALMLNQNYMNYKKREIWNEITGYDRSIKKEIAYNYDRMTFGKKNCWKFHGIHWLIRWFRFCVIHWRVGITGTVFFSVSFFMTHYSLLAIIKITVALPRHCLRRINADSVPSALSSSF